MSHSFLLPGVCGLLLLGVLSGCHRAASTDPDAAEPASQVAVTTVQPVQQIFHDTVEAWGHVVGDPQRASTISVAHAGQVTALNVVSGQVVSRGQALLTMVPDPAARNAFRQAQTSLTLARGELARTEQLAAQRLATQSQLASARKALADAQAALQAQRALGGGAAEETIRAPSAGVVTALSVSLGDRVAANAPLLDFSVAHALVAQLGVQPEDGARLRAGMAVQLHGVYGDRAPFNGTLQVIGQSINPQTHLLDAQVTLSAASRADVMVGAALDAKILVANFSAWAVPRAAVLHDAQGTYLFQLEHGHARRVTVTLRSPDGDTVGVLGALDAQAPVIVLGAYELHDGDAVRMQAPAASTSSPSLTAAATQGGA